MMLTGCDATRKLLLLLLHRLTWLGRWEGKCTPVILLWRHESSALSLLHCLQLVVSWIVAARTYSFNLPLSIAGTGVLHVLLSLSWIERITPWHLRLSVLLHLWLSILLHLRLGVLLHLRGLLVLIRYALRLLTHILNLRLWREPIQSNRVRSLLLLRILCQRAHVDICPAVLGTHHELIERLGAISFFHFRM